MVLILTPPNNEVKNISAIGNNVIVNKKINFLSLKFMPILKLERIKRSKINIGINRRICFIKKIKGYNKWFNILIFPNPLKGSPKDLHKAYCMLPASFVKIKYKCGKITKK